jgi:hypothetical protein
MKYLILFFCSAAFAQNPLVGAKWHTTGHLGTDPASEFVFVKDTLLFEAGFIFRATEDGQFTNSYSNWCANDCFKTNTGTWTMIDSTHISFRLTGQKIIGSWCGQDAFPKELGLYAIINKNGGMVRLIKSDGTVQGDALMLRYSTLANALQDELIDDYYEKGLSTQHTDETEPDKVFARFIEANGGYKGAKLVFITTDVFALPVLLFEHKKKLYALVQDKVKNEVAFYGAVN